MSTIKQAEAMIEAVDRIVSDRGVRRSSIEFVTIYHGRAVFAVVGHPTKPIAHQVPDLAGHRGIIRPTEDGWQAEVKDHGGARGSVPVEVRK